LEIKILRKIFGPNIQADGSWRIKTNEEFYKLTKEKNIVRKIKSRRTAWLVQLE
jgi:predicted small secreted protein